MEKLKHQAPKGYIINRFNFIELENYHYCKSHNYVFDPKIQEELLYWAKPCYYTDLRYESTSHNFYGDCYLFDSRFKDIPLKTCIRKTLSCRNIPINTVVNFRKSWYFLGKGKGNIDLSYKFKIKKENNFNPEYEINDPLFFNNFKQHKKYQQLVEALRENGFLVKVYNENPDFLIGEQEGGEIAIAHGHGKIIGFSTSNHTFRGYQNGCDNILWEKYGEFDKWSRCREINKSNKIKDIIKILL